MNVAGFVLAIAFIAALIVLTEVCALGWLAGVLEPLRDEQESDR